MLESFILSINIISPIFVLILLGVFFRKKQVVDEIYIKKSNHLIYTYAMPINLFHQIYIADFRSITDTSYIFYAVFAIICIALFLSIITPLFIKDKRRCGSFIQNSFRSNFVLLGTVMATSLFGETGAIATILLIPFAVITLTISSIVILTIFSDEVGKKIDIKNILKSVMKNPVIIGILIGFIVKFLNINLPAFAEDSIKSFSNIVTPLALICLGAEIKFEKMKDAKQVILCSTLKLIAIPLITIVPAIVFFNFSGYQIGALYFLFCAPCGISNYSLIYSMKSDYKFASNVIIVSSFLSFATMIIGISMLISLGFFVL